MAKRKNTKLSEWQKRASEGGVCEKCFSRVPRLTVDHVIPVSIVDMFDQTGVAKYEEEVNFQLLCHQCNAFKACRLDVKNPKTKPLLMKMLDSV